MGIDACIYFKTHNGEEPTLCHSLPQGCIIRPAREWAIEGATHEVDQPWRYYGPGYERGPWPLISTVLMVLHASLDVQQVWYFGDTCGGDEPFTSSDVIEFSKHYMAEGTRPYSAIRKSLTNKDENVIIVW